MKHIMSENITFEQAMNELDSITKKLEQGNLELDDAIAYYEKGSNLINYCEKKLNAAKLKVEKIVKGSSAQNENEIKLEVFNV